MTRERLVQLRDRAALSHFLMRDAALHIYEIGDLDAFFFADTQWFAWQRHDGLQSIALLYSGTETPTLLVLERENAAASQALLEALGPQLPSRFFAHLSPGLRAYLPREASISYLGPHKKMLLRGSEYLADGDITPVALRPNDEGELRAFYEAAYPENWFVPRMLETGQYLGVRVAGTLVAAAGVHVYSPEYGVAALGNIATHPHCRGKGYAKAVTAALCTQLGKTVSSIGLNVHADNAAALACYRTLGFDEVAEYGEYLVTNR